MSSCFMCYKGDTRSRNCIRNLHRTERSSIWCKLMVPKTFKHGRPIKLHNFLLHLTMHRTIWLTDYYQTRLSD